MEWNEETIARLRALWAEGHSTAEIGRRLAITKNAVVGKAHRLGLPARPSPIRREPANGASARVVSPRRTVGPTLPPLPGAAPATLPAGERSMPQRLAPERPVAAPVAEVRERRPAAAALPRPVAAGAARPGRLVTCCWPIGEPGTKSFRFCDDDAMAGKPYCADHAQLAYVKVRDRREEAA